MPNWCNNSVTFSNGSERELDRLVKAYNENRLFNEFVPVPQELRETTAPNNKNADEMIEKYGYADWYSWQVDNWGTKWDVESVNEIEREDGQMDVTVYFDSAWSPPLEFFRKMEEQGWTVRAYYYEPGMAFCGCYEDGNDECYQIEGNSAWVKENIPEVIDEMFAISESMEQWEEEEKEDV